RRFGSPVDATPVVHDLEAERAGLEPHDDGGACTPRVLQRVGQGLLHDAVRGEVDAPRDGGTRALVRDVHRQAGVADLAYEPVELAQAGRRGVTRPGGDADVRRLAEDTEHAADLRERRAADL